MATKLDKSGGMMNFEYGDGVASTANIGFSSKGANCSVLGTGPTKGGKWLESVLTAASPAGSAKFRGHSNFGPTPTGTTPCKCWKFAYYFDTAPASSAKILDMGVSLDSFTLHINTSRQLFIRSTVGDYVLPTALTAATEYYVAIYTRVAAIDGGGSPTASHVVVFVDGTVALNIVTPTNVNPGTTPTFSEDTQRSFTQRIGALVWHWEEKAAPWGPLSVIRLTPNANGGLAEAGWVSHSGGAADYTHWDDATPSSSDADYNKATNNLISLTSALPTLPNAGDVPVFVAPRGWHKLSASSKIGASVGHSLYDGTNEVTEIIVNPDTTWTQMLDSSFSPHIAETAPDAGAWTKTDIDNLEVGAYCADTGGVNWYVGLMSADVVYQANGVSDYAALPNEPVSVALLNKSKRMAVQPAPAMLPNRRPFVGLFAAAAPPVTPNRRRWAAHV